ncbi:MAG TPA: M23 family metallopeptidase [Xanthobacteraceae bacterium]|jgi:murein DD-endopeptidase MepM/ murein hydrolase activator NlpD|nr:M23 family metallopeptidase [Xanthobacteraceae bacterium]
MSQWSASQSQRTARAQFHARDVARSADPRQPGASRPASGAGYTIVHAGRQIRFGPVAFWIAVGTMVILAGWTVTTATYFAFSDDVIKGILARQAEQQYAYEDRIAELRAQIDRTTSHQLLDQEQFEQKLDQLLRRETTLESRATALGGGADPSTTGSLRPGAGAPGIAAAPRPLDRGTYLEPDHAPGARRSGKEADIGAKLQRIEASLDRVDHRETSTLAQLEQQYEGKARKMHGVLADLGLRLDAAPPATGGPFVPVALPTESQSFERALTRVSIARAYADRLSATLVTVPLRKPVTGEIDETSPFGVRVDPFLHVPAMHTGIDFRGTLGEPIHATASGTVTSAGWSGGYGQMVEIDHGNGLATRYGHMSEIDVKVGQTIRIGQVIGRLGSTGRSTGPHVHYETRVNGEAVNPQKFLDAGEKLFGG